MFKLTSELLCEFRHVSDSTPHLRQILDRLLSFIIDAILSVMMVGGNRCIAMEVLVQLG